MWSLGIGVALVLSILPFAPTASPIHRSPRTVAAAAHNLYLVTCAPRSRGDDSRSGDNVTAVAYFRNPIPTDERNPSPDQYAVISDPSKPWDGAKLQVEVWRSKVFSSGIDAGAKSLTKGSIAGSAKLDSEGYVCFKDGETGFRINDDSFRGTCVADYWCASVSGSTTGD